MARDEWGHLALVTALSVVDDTTLLRKAIVSELQVGCRAGLPPRGVWLVVFGFLFLAALSCRLAWPSAGACGPGCALCLMCRRTQHEADACILHRTRVLRAPALVPGAR